MATVGFLGLGSMGAAMATRLVGAGHDVVVWNRSPEAVGPLVEAGARRAGDPAEALGAGTSFSMLAHDRAVDDVLTQDVLAAGADGVHVCMSTISPAAGDRLEARATAAGVGYAACPVLGRPTVAADGALNLLFAGPADLREQAEPFLEAMGRRTWDLGIRPRSANVVKAAINYNIIHALQAIGESVATVEAHGVPAAAFTDLLAGTLFGGVVYTGYGDLIARRRYDPPGFSMRLGLKDLGLAEEVAAERGLTLASATVLRTAFETALADPELADLDWAAVAEVSRRAVPPAAEQDS